MERLKKCFISCFASGKMKNGDRRKNRNKRRISRIRREKGRGKKESRIKRCKIRTKGKTKTTK